MSTQVQTLLAPRSVAIVGASANRQKLSNIVLRNIKDGGYSGRLYPVNPNDQTIEGLQSYSNYVHIPEIPDLAVVVVPAPIVATVLREIGQKGTRAVVIISAGFKEESREGALREMELQEIAREFDMSLLGPNCLGFVNTRRRLNATFGQKLLNKGEMHFLSQSGAIASSLFDWAEHHAIGFEDFITMGNKAGLTENDLLMYWYDQLLQKQAASVEKKFNESGYAPIGMYLESLSDGTSFIEIASEVAKHTPVFLLKPGRTPAAQKAMQSHTGSIAGDDAVLSQALKQAGVIRCDTIEEMFDFSMAFSWSRVPEGPNVAILSNAGGPAVVSSDAVVESGLTMATLSKNTKELLSTHLPRAASILNPVDVLGDALSDRYEKALRVLLEEEKVDSVVVILTPQVMTQIEETAKVIGRLAQRYNTPIFCSFMGAHNISKGEEVLSKYKIPFFRYPERAITILGKMWWWKQWQLHAGKKSTQIDVTPVPQSVITYHLEDIRKQLIAGNQYLSSEKINQLFDDWDIATPASTSVTSLDQAKRFAKQTGYPVVLKLSAPELLHKTEVSGVITDVRSAKQLEVASQTLINRKTELAVAVRKNTQIQIQAQVEGGVEVIVGVKRTSQFGMVLMFGAGGTLVELIQDRNLHVLPATATDIEKLVTGSKVYALLTGYRGKTELALPKLYHLIAQLANLVQTLPFFSEIEINPVIVTPLDAVAVDGKAILSEF
ncbi:MAG: acetate--CoA ligase family protein [Pseudomonadales bacterium]|nr:acetate--CoA ligase family protein [Candidatus Woesebacteria bacterium]MCB9801283.1 acetate--CoA ligase family protein [Pseudomonadales bacterium]